MAIRSSEIDPAIAQALAAQEEALMQDHSGEEAEGASEGGEGEAADQPPMTPDPDAEKKKAALEALKKAGGKPGFSWADKLGMIGFGGALVGAGAWLGPALGHDWMVWAGGLTGGMLAFGGLFGDLRRMRPGRTTETGDIAYTAGVLAALLPLLTDLNPVERRYGDLLAVLACDPPPLPAEDRRALLAQINGLLSDSRSLAALRAEVQANLAGADAATLTAERDRLLAEADASDDAVVRDAKRQAAQMVAQRLDDAASVARTVARMQAQEEAIHATLGALHTGLTRLRLAPSELKAKDVLGLQDTIDRVQGQTRAVEAAVQEVLSLRAG